MRQDSPRKVINLSLTLSRQSGLFSEFCEALFVGANSTPRFAVGYGDPPHLLVYYARGAVERRTESDGATTQAQIDVRRFAFGVENDIH